MPEHRSTTSDMRPYRVLPPAVWLVAAGLCLMWTTAASAQPADEDGAAPAAEVEAGAEAGVEAEPPPAPPPMTKAQAQALFDELFAGELQRVQQTPQPTDDVDLAARLLDAVDTAAERPQLQAVICAAAARLGSVDLAGYPTAIAAYERLASLDPAQALDATEKALELRQRRFYQSRGDERKEAAAEFVDAALSASERIEAAGEIERAMAAVRMAQQLAPATGEPGTRDRVMERMRQLAGKVAALNQIDKLKQRLRLNPDDTGSAEELIRLCVVDLNDPHEAFKYTMLVKDEKLKTNVKTATLELEQVEPRAAMDAGTWYLSLADGAREAGQKLAMLEQAALLYDHFLAESADQQGLLHTKATMDRKRIGDQMAALRKQVEPDDGGGEWVDLMTRVDMRRLPRSGFEKRGDFLVVGSVEDAVLEFAEAPRGPYEFRVKLARTEGSGNNVGLMLTLVDPRGGENEWSCTFVVHGNNGNFAGLDAVDGQHFASQRNPTTARGVGLRAGRKLEVRVKVEPLGDDVKVTGYIGNVAVVGYAGPIRRLGRGEWNTGGELGIVADRAALVIYEAAWRPLKSK